MFGETKSDNLDDEIVSTFAKEIAATGGASSDNAESLDDLCDALFHGDTIAGPQTVLPEAETELKPYSFSGFGKFIRQLDNWRNIEHIGKEKIGPFMYDPSGQIHFMGTF